MQQVSGDVNQAIATYGKLIAMQPLSPQPHVRLAEAQVANKDNQAAEQSLRKALEIKPDFLDAQRGLILLDVEAKKYPDAIKIARTVQEQRPKAAVGYVLEGDIDARAEGLGLPPRRPIGPRCSAAPAPELAIKLHAVLLASGKAAEADAVCRRPG